jgi:hypothetical protein
MATINVKDAAGSTVALEKPLPPGAAAAAASRPVTLATDDALVTATGATSDAAVAAGGAGSLSAKLRRLTNDLGALLTAFGAALTRGAGNTDSNTQRVVLANDSAGVITTGTAGTPSAVVLSVQGVASMTPVKVDGGSIGLSNKLISAAFSTLTRPANTTAYSGGDSISDNATAASVTALSATVSDVNDDPIFISEILISSTDTGLAGKRIRAYLFNADPTANTGVGGGDNAAYSQKRAGYIGSCSGVLESGFSDGTVGRLVPSFADGAAAGSAHAMAGGFVVTKPTSGAKTLFIQYQAVDAFTPSANSTTIIATARGWQGRAV